MLNARSSAASLRRWAWLGATAWLALLAAGLGAGPKLGDHEVIVAQTARQMLATGDWLIPRYLDTPFLVKPPLSPWLIAAASRVSPAHASGRPNPDWVARLPSAIATILTVFVVWRLARSMYDRPAALMATTVCATSVGTLLFAFNATAEAVLTFFCTWAYAAFWWAQRARSPGRRRAHLAQFYVALGLGMLTKGPMPLIVVATPLAAWWWSQRSARLLADVGPRGAGAAARLWGRGFLPRFGDAWRRLGLVWGVPLFLAMFVPWMIFVGWREPYAWQLWDYEYLDRARGAYPGCHWGDLHYYIPILFGMVLPWCLSLPEALAAPFLWRYRAERRPLTYAWHWVVGAVAIASVMSFKKPYYILPVLPGCALLLGPVLRHFFLQRVIQSMRRARWGCAAVLVAFAGLSVTMWLFAGRMYPEEWHGFVTWGSIVLGCLAFGVLVLTCRAYLAAQRWKSFALVGACGAGTFILCWIALGPALANVEDAQAVADGLNRSHVDARTPLYWASNRPDGRVLYYGGRPLLQVVDIYRFIAEFHDLHDRDELRRFAAERICGLLEAAKPVYLVLQRKDLNMLMAFFRPPAHELFEVDRGAIGPDGEDWVVVTNAPLPAGAS